MPRPWNSRPKSEQRPWATSSASLVPGAPLPPDPADGTVRIASAPDPNREVRDALRTCLRWAREDGIAFHEMVIAYRQADPYRPLIAGALREAKLPAYIDEGTPLSELPLGRRALALLDLLSGDLERAVGDRLRGRRRLSDGDTRTVSRQRRRMGRLLQEGGRGPRLGPVARPPAGLPRRRGTADRRGRQPPRLARQAAGRDRRAPRIRRGARTSASRNVRRREPGASISHTSPICSSPTSTVTSPITGALTALAGWTA